MSERARWETLACPCGSEAFLKRYTLRRHPQGGMSEDAAGLQCAACGTAADTGQLWQQLRRRNLQEQMAALETELATTQHGARPGTTPASSPASNG